MSKTYDAEVIRQRLNTTMARRVVFSLLVKRADMDRSVQLAGVERTVRLFLDHDMWNDALRFEKWWKKSEENTLTLDDIYFSSDAEGLL